MSNGYTPPSVLREQLYRLFRPWLWLLQGKYDKEVDTYVYVGIQLNMVAPNPYTGRSINSLSIGGRIFYVADYPSTYAIEKTGPYDEWLRLGQKRPSAQTIVKLRKEQKKLLKREYSLNWRKTHEYHND